MIFFLRHLDAYNEMVVSVIMGVSQTEDCILQRLHLSAVMSSNLAEGHLNRCHGPGARFNKEVQPTLSLNLNSELSYSEMGNSGFSVTERLNCVSLLNSK